MPGWETLYELNWMQEETYTDLADIYVYQTKIQHGGQTGHESTPSFSNVPCKLKRTPDFEIVQQAGILTESDIMTQDNWNFHARQPCATLYGIVMKTPGHPEFGHWWQVQGEPKVAISAGIRELDNQIAYAKEESPPSNVQISR